MNTASSASAAGTSLLLPEPPRRVSLPSQTAQRLREALQSGVWAAQGRMPGERELARHMQVSRQTVRAALQLLGESGLVAAGGDRRRRLVSQDPGAAGGVASGRMVRVVSSRPLEHLAPSLVMMLDLLRESLARADMRLEIHTAATSRSLAALTSRHEAAAWLLVGTLQPVQAWFERSALPSLVVGTCSHGVSLPSIDTGYRATCRHAGSMLLRQGHRHIALIRPEAALGGEEEAEEGVREAVEPRGGRLTVLRHNGTAVHLSSLLAGLMQRPKAARPTAWLIGRAEHVLTAMMYAQTQGLRIPRDVAIVSRDDEAFLQHTVPEVTRYATHGPDFARRLFRATRRLAESGSLPRVPVRLMPRLISGETC